MSTQQSIGHYRIISKLGEGGMGTVYRATDSRLRRDVAIKVLPETFAADADRMARFEREAQMLAALNHPNIAAIYGIEHSAIVMELVDGEELKGPTTVDTAIAYAKQLTAALEAAHEKGIIHRDLKPANIKITPEGILKVLDFGLAKAAEERTASSAASPTMSPTLSLAMTQPGMILGTAAYMSPEQARGKTVDKRTDIWAFGVILYEMLAGNHPHGVGETVTDTLAAVVLKDPDWSALPADTPPRVRRLLERCLRKDPRQRLRDIGDARLILDEAEPAASASPLTASRRRVLPFFIALGVVTVAAAALGFGWWSATRPLLRPMMRVSVDLGPDAVRGTWSSAILTPDGSKLLYYVRQPDGGTGIAIRRIDQPNGTPIAPDATSAFLAPDGRSLGFSSGGKVKVMPIEGGAATTVFEGLGNHPGSWGEDGLLYINDGNGRITAVPVGGGAPRRVTDPKQMKEYGHYSPFYVTGRRALIYTAVPAAAVYDAARAEAVSLDSGRMKVLLEGAYGARYIDGYLIYEHENRILAAKFDPDRLQVKGPPVTIVEDLASSQSGELFELSSAGVLIYRSGKGDDRMWPVSWINQQGEVSRAIAPSAVYHTPRLSPDGKRLAVTIQGAKGWDLWTFDVERGTSMQLTFDGSAGSQEVIWTPDGQRIVYATDEPSGLWWTRSDGAGKPQNLSDKPTRPQSFSPDGKYMVTTGGGLFAIPLDLSAPEHPKAGERRQLMLEAGVHDAEVSPDGRWIAYVKIGAVHEDLYVVGVRDLQSATAGKWRITQAGAKFPRWSRTARQLFFYAPDGHIMVADYTVRGDSFVTDTPRVWSSARVLRTGVIANFDLAPDGKRVVAFPRPHGEADEGGSVHVTMLLNFFDELKRRLP
jgi:serine/threonine-protein kinase